MHETNQFDCYVEFNNVNRVLYNFITKYLYKILEWFTHQLHNTHKET